MKPVKSKGKRFKFGSVMQKVILLLEGGLTLGMTTRPDKYFQIIKGISKEWQEINKRTLKDAIRTLYASKLVGYKSNEDGTVSLTLTDAGKKKILQYDPNSIKIKKPMRWDGFWRVVIFDIPEYKKKARDALANRLKYLGFYPIQKSVFIYPYECKDEIDFITEIFDLRPHVRFILAKEIDVDLDLKSRFKL